MTINKLPAQFNGQSLEIVIIGGERWAMSSQIGYSLGFTFPIQSMGKLFKRNRAEFGPDDTMAIEMPDALGRDQLTRLYSAKGIAKIAMFANTPKAAAFRDWAATALTTPPPEPVLAAPIPAIGATAMTELRKGWLALSKHRPFVKYAKMGLSNREIALLLNWKRGATVTKKRRTAEALGLIEAPAGLAMRRRLGHQLGFGTMNPVTRHLELQRAKDGAAVQS